MVAGIIRVIVIEAPHKIIVVRLGHDKRIILKEVPQVFFEALPERLTENILEFVAKEFGLNFGMNPWKTRKDFFAY